MNATCHSRRVLALTFFCLASICHAQPPCGEGRQLTMGKLKGQAQLSADGSRIVMAAGEQAVICDVSTGAIIRGYSKEGAASQVWQVALSADGAMVGAIYASGEGVLWDAATGDVMLQTGRRSTGILYNIGNILLKITTNGWFITGGTEFFDIFDVATGTRLEYHHVGIVRDITDDGSRFVGRKGGFFQVHESATWTILATLEGSDALDLSSRAVAFSSDGTRVAMISGNRILLWDAGTGNLIGTREYTREIVSSLDWQVSTIVACNDSNVVSIISPATLREVRAIQSPGPANLAGLSGDGNRVWFHSQLLPRSNGPAPGEIRVHELADGTALTPFHSGGNFPAAVSDDGIHVYTPLLTNSNTTDYIQYSALAWNQNGQATTRMDLYTRDTVEDAALAVTPDGGDLMANNRIYDAQSGELLRRVSMPIALWEADWVQFAPAGRYVMLGYHDVYFVFDTHLDRMAYNSAESLAFVPMYADVVARAIGNTLEYVSLLDGTVLTTKPLPYPMTHIAFNRQGANLLAGVNDSDLVVVDIASGQEMQRIDAPPGESYHVVALSPNGELAAATTRYAEVIDGLGYFAYNQHLFSVETGELMATYDPLRARPVFTPLGDTLLWVGTQVTRHTLAPCAEGEGAAEGEGLLEGEGAEEGSLDGEGVIEGEGIVEEGEGGGAQDGEAQTEGNTEAEGAIDGGDEGEGSTEGEGSVDGEGQGEAAGEGEGEGHASNPASIVLAGFYSADDNGDRLLSMPEFSAAFPGLAGGFNALDTNGSARIAIPELQQLVEGPSPIHSADTNADTRIALPEVIRAIQLRNAGGYTCSADPELTEDGYTIHAGGSLPMGCRAHASDYQQRNAVISLGELLRLVQLYNSGDITPCPAGEDGFCAVAN